MNQIYEQYADLLEYPSTDWGENLTACTKLVSGHELELVTSFSTCFDKACDLSSLQETYTRTFDLNPVCTLDIGYHLFGEAYKRGVFLANLHETEEPFNLGQEHQLPDYLPVLLRLIARLDDEEQRTALIAECIVPALQKMEKALLAAGNPYRYLLEAIHSTLESDVGIDLIQSEAHGSAMRASLPVLQHAEHASA